MKNLFKFVLFAALLSAGISLLYDYQLHHGRLDFLARATPEKYTLAANASVDPKGIPTLAELDRERRVLVSSVVPSVVSIKTSRKIMVRRQQALDPFEFFFNRMPQQYRSPRDEALVQNSRLRCCCDQ